MNLLTYYLHSFRAWQALRASTITKQIRSCMMEKGGISNKLSRMDTGRNDDWVIRFWSAHTQVSRKYDMIHDALIRWRGLYNNF